MKKIIFSLLLIFSTLQVGYAASVADIPPPPLPTCTVDNWSCTDWDACSPSGSQARICNKISDCDGGVEAPQTSQNCIYSASACTSWTYSEWGACSNGQQTRTILSSSPENCTGGSPVLTQSCSMPRCEADIWNCSDWTECKFNPGWMHDDANNGIRTRTCNRTFDCLYSEGTPEMSLGCTPQPVITSISPSIIYPSTKVTINGYNFGLRGLYSYDTYCPKCQIKVNDQSASAYSWQYDWSNTSIGFTMPNNATSGYMTIVDKNGNESNKFNFSLTPTPPPVSQPAEGSFKLIIPSGRDKGVLYNDKIKIDYYGSDIITKLYLNSVEISLGVDQFNIISYSPLSINHQIVSFFPPINSKSGDLIVNTANNKTKNVGYLKVFESVPQTNSCSAYENASQDLSGKCYCNYGYQWNTDKTKCIWGPKNESSSSTNINDSDGDGVPDNIDFNPNNKSELITRKYSFNYRMLGENHGQTVDFNIEIPKDLYLYYLNQNHVFSNNYQNITNFITSDDPVIKDIIKQINTLYKEKGLIPIPLIYQLSGEIVYSEDKFSIKGWDEYPKYPIETLVDGHGDCEDTAFLLATLYKAFGMEPVLVRFENHLGIAIAVDQNTLDLVVYKLGKDFMADINDKLPKNKLIYLESTGNTNWDFGFMPKELQGKPYTIHTLDEYKRTSGTLQQVANSSSDVPKQQVTGFFSDVSKNYQNAAAIQYLKDKSIINGYSDGTFKPENSINRAELLKILVEGKIGKPDESKYKNCFSDVKTEWFAPYVCYAKSVGWVEGYSNGKFKPSQTVNKVEALKMLLNSQDISVSSATNKPFEDVKTTDWFAKYVSKAKEMGILEETGDTFAPSQGMKRAGISENLYRILTK